MQTTLYHIGQELGSQYNARPLRCVESELAKREIIHIFTIFS